MSAKFVVLLGLVACAFAAEEEQRVKKDVLLGTIPYAYSAVPYTYPATYDIGKYYPAKYEKTVLSAAQPFATYHANPVVGAAPVAAHVAPISPVVPAASISAYSAHTVHPLPYGGYPYHYGAYPYHYGAYPNIKSYVY